MSTPTHLNSLPTFTFHYNLRDRCNLRNKTLIRADKDKGRGKGKETINRKWRWGLSRSSYRLTRTNSNTDSDIEEVSTSVVSM